MDVWESLTKIIQSIITSSAILIGGIWAYYKFVRGRVYKPRLELAVACKRYSQTNEIVRLHVTVVLKNVGLSKVNIDTESSGMRIYKVVGSDFIGEAREPEWARIKTFNLFEKHRWIEPSEVISDERFVECKSPDPVFKVEAIVMSKTQQWYSSAISAGGPDDDQ